LTDKEAKLQKYDVYEIMNTAGEEMTGRYKKVIATGVCIIGSFFFNFVPFFHLNLELTTQRKTR
jgi:hypothetical protein